VRELGSVQQHSRIRRSLRVRTKEVRLYPLVTRSVTSPTRAVSLASPEGAVASNHCEPDFHQQTTTVWFFITVGPFYRDSTSHSDAPPVIHAPYLDAAASLYGNTTSQDPPAPHDGGAVAIFVPPGEPGRTRSTIYQQLTEGITLCQGGHEGACRNMPNTMVHQGATPGPAIPPISQPERCTSRVHRSESSPNRPRPSRLVQTTLVSP